MAVFFSNYLLLSFLFSTGLTLQIPQYRPSVAPSLPQQFLDAVLRSPLYGWILVPQARRTMVATAEVNGIPWESALAWIKRSKDSWDDELLKFTDHDTLVRNC